MPLSDGEEFEDGGDGEDCQSCQSENEDELPPLQDESQIPENSETTEEHRNPEEDKNTKEDENNHEPQEPEEKESGHEPQEKEEHEDEPEEPLVPGVPKTPKDKIEPIEIDDSPEYSGTAEIEAQERFASQRESLEEQITDISAKLNIFKKMAASKFLSAIDSTFFCFVFGVMSNGFSIMVFRQHKVYPID